MSASEGEKGRGHDFTLPAGTPEDDQTLVQPIPDEEALFGAAASDTGFNYSAFEESLADIDHESQDRVTDPGEAADQVHERLTLDTSRFPKDDATADTRELGSYTVLTIRGRINESFPGAEIGAKLRGNVLFDLTEVDRDTSFGVRAWLQMLDAARIKDAVFVRASPAIVNQVTMMRNFCGPARIHSIVAPYSCESCGVEFGVPYDAVDDRASLRARNPLKIACPQCLGPSRMDEDPWVFFALDELLVDEISVELQRVLDNLGDAPRHAPIEKAITNDVTRVRFNGVVSADTRFQRAFSGLEGEVQFDFRTATDVDAGGTRALLDQLGRLPDEVARLVIEGAPVALLSALVERPIPKVWVTSAAVRVRSLARPLERVVLVDLKRERVALASGTFAPDVPWRDDPVEVADLELLKAASTSLIPPDPRAPTPVPAPRAQVQPAPAAVPATTGRGPASALVAALAGGFAIALVLGGVLGGALFFMNPGSGTPTVSAVVPPPVPAAPVEVADGQWSSGGATPPAWSEVGFAQADGAVSVVGHGSGASMQEATVQARRAALDRLLTHAGANLVPLFADETLPADGPDREAALVNFEMSISGLNLTRAAEASMKSGDRHEFVARYAVDAEALNTFLREYQRVSSFRGIKVAQSAPWRRPGVRLVERESYVRNVAPGDLLVRVAGQPAETLVAFDRASQSAFGRLSGGESMTLEFDRAGTSVSTTILRPNNTQPAPSPSAAPTQPTAPVTPRPTLFRKDD